jgi:multidrug efflux pump subunit AcrA (membrane-fusion protein)
MRILNTSIWYILIAITLVLVAGFFVYKTINPSVPEWVTATVERGDVSEVISVSGFVEAKRTAELAFPSTGVVTDVFVEEGAQVKQGDILATLAATQLVAERAEAVGALAAARATYEKTIAGPRTETLAVAKTTLSNAEENLTRVTAEEKRKVENARIALLSTGLTAVAIDTDETSTAPTVSGTYLCQDEGTYELNVYNSGGQSGYSYN